MRVIPIGPLVALLMILPLASCIASTEYPALKELRRMQASYFFDDPVQRSLANAVERGNIDQARVAIENGAEVNAVGKEGMVPLFWALTKQNIDGFRFLLEQGADPNIVVNLPRHFQDRQAGAMEMAAQLENPAYLKALLEHGGDPNIIVNKGWDMPVLYRSIMSRRPDNVLLLIKFGADIDHRDNAGQTPLIKATNATMFELALLLLRQGADPTIKDRLGDGPAEIVMQFGNRGIDRRTNDLAAFDEFVEELKARELLQKDPRRFD